MEKDVAAPLGQTQTSENKLKRERPVLIVQRPHLGGVACERTSSPVPSVADDPGPPNSAVFHAGCSSSPRLSRWKTAVGGSVLISRFETIAHGTTQLRRDAAPRVLVVAQRE